MTEDKLIRFIDKLLNKSGLLWKQTAIDGEFETILPSSLTTIATYIETSRYYMNVVAGMKIHNEDGIIIEDIRREVGQSTKLGNLLEDLHRSAKRNYYEVDKIMDELLIEIDSL